MNVLPSLHRASPNRQRSKRSLVIVGTGIAAGQITLEALACIDRAEIVLALVTDPIALQWLKTRNASTQSLHHFYVNGKSRTRTYAQIVDHVMSHLHDGSKVCFVLYGHPGVFASPAHELLRRCRIKQIRVEILPGVSAEDCLFADLGLDPGTSGCQSFEATDFLLRSRKFDPTTPLLLWQFAITGDLTHPDTRHSAGIQILAQFLANTYGSQHEVVVYQATPYPFSSPIIQKIALHALYKADSSPMSTLYVPPLPARPINRAMARRLGISR